MIYIYEKWKITIIHIYDAKIYLSKTCEYYKDIFLYIKYKAYMNSNI